jgi:hypothetical protein
MRYKEGEDALVKVTLGSDCPRGWRMALMAVGQQFYRFFEPLQSVKHRSVMLFSLVIAAT